MDKHTLSHKLYCFSVIKEFSYLRIFSIKWKPEIIARMASRQTHPAKTKEEINIIHATGD